jgi:hypothetical protein
MVEAKARKRRRTEMRFKMIFNCAAGVALRKRP